MKRKTVPALSITKERALHAIHLLVAEGKIAATDVAAAMKRRETLIRDLRDRLVALEQGVVSAIERTGRQLAGKVARKKRKMAPARRAELQLQGRYLGHVRPLSKAAKAKVKAIREKYGVRAAIAAAKKMAKSAR